MKSLIFVLLTMLFLGCSSTSQVSYKDEPALQYIIVTKRIYMMDGTVIEYKEIEWLTTGGL